MVTMPTMVEHTVHEPKVYRLSERKFKRVTLVKIMAVWVAMLRGVNVGGNQMLPMDKFRLVCEGLGLVRPQTFIQSGNVVFETGQVERAALAEQLEKALGKTFGFTPSVILRDVEEMRGVVARNPFAGREDVAPNRLLVTFLKGDPGEAARVAVRAIPAAPEELYIDGSELFIFYPEGAGRTKLPVAKIDRAHGQVGTSRNWNSVLKLLAMAEGRE